MEWMQVFVIILSGAYDTDPPRTGIWNSVRYPTQKACEANLLSEMLNKFSSATVEKASSIFISSFNQLSISTSKN